jgi:hypothetical protein
MSLTARSSAAVPFQPTPASAPVRDRKAPRRFLHLRHENHTKLLSFA